MFEYNVSFIGFGSTVACFGSSYLVYEIFLCILANMK